jgi:hypothetical protein
MNFTHFKAPKICAKMNLHSAVNLMQAADGVAAGFANSHSQNRDRA